MTLSIKYAPIGGKLCGIWITHSGESREVEAARIELTRIKHELIGKGYQPADAEGVMVEDSDGESVLRAFDDTNLTLVMKARGFEVDDRRLNSDLGAFAAPGARMH